MPGHVDLEGTKVSIDAATTSTADLDANVAAGYDPSAVSSGDCYDTTIGPLSATRLRVWWGIDLDAKRPIANLILYLIEHESTVY